MLVKSYLTSKDTSLWSSGICIVLIASMKLSVDCSLCRDLSVKGLRMLVKCFETILKPISAHVFTANHITYLPTATLSIDQSNRSPGFLNFQLTNTTT